MRTYKCPACHTKSKVKTSSICPSCYALVEPDPSKKIINPEKEQLIPAYQQRAAQEQPLFSSCTKKGMKEKWHDAIITP